MQGTVDLHQENDIVGSIPQLLLRQRALRPVGAGVQLVQRDAEHGLDQVAVTDLVRVAEQRCRNLGIEQRRRHALVEMVENFQVCVIPQLL